MAKRLIIRISGAMGEKILLDTVYQRETMLYNIIDTLVGDGQLDDWVEVFFYQNGQPQASATRDFRRLVSGFSGVEDSDVFFDILISRELYVLSVEDLQLIHEAVKEKNWTLYASMEKHVGHILRAIGFCQDKDLTPDLLAELVPPIFWLNPRVLSELLAKNPNLLQFVPLGMRRRFPELIAFKAETAVPEVLQEIIEQTEDPNMLMELIERNGLALKFMSHALQDRYPQVVKAALNQNYHALAFVSPSLLLKEELYPSPGEPSSSDRGIFLLASSIIKQRPEALDYIPDHLKVYFFDHDDSPQLNSTASSSRYRP